MPRVQSLADMLIDQQAFEKARQTRDPRFDGRFFIGVRTTGVYCRPVCPVKIASAENVKFFLTAAAAADAGYRPCLRCRPEASPGTPAWTGTSTTVSRALRMIAAGALDEQNITQLCDRLGVTPRHLSRLFSSHLGAAPGIIAQTRRLQFAKKLLDETDMPMTGIAMASGYGSVRRFNDHFKSTYRRAPSSLRRQRSLAEHGDIKLTFPYREPFDFDGLMDFFAQRAIPGVEEIRADQYSRTAAVADANGSRQVVRICVSRDREHRRIECRIRMDNPASLVGIAEKVKRLFDLSALPAEINAHLARDRGLTGMVKNNPGLRLPGAWDVFETSVRAIVGQQVSVKSATTVMGKIAARYGSETPHGLLFPTVRQLARLVPDGMPMPQSRALAIREFAKAVLAHRVDFDAAPECLREQLLAIKGLGPWTAQYICMRALGDPDAFPVKDLVLLRMARQHLAVDGPGDLAIRSEQWRPWRAYAVMHLWRQAGT